MEKEGIDFREMTEEEYKKCIVKMLEQLKSSELERIFKYTHRVYITCARN